MSNRKANKERSGEGPDEYDQDLERDNRRDGDPDARTDAPAGGTTASMGTAHLDTPLGPSQGQKDRKGQAQSPRELTHDEQPRQKEGH